MQCHEVRSLAEAFVSEQLLVETTQAIIAHLETCPGCRAEIDGLRRLRTATRAAFERSTDLGATPDFTASVIARLREEAAHRRSSFMSRRRWLAVAAGAIIATAVGLRQWSTSIRTTLANAAVGDHRFCALSFKLAEPPIRLAEAVRRYGGIYGALESVEPDKTILLDGPLQIVERHACVFAGRRFAHLVLRYKEETVSLLIPGDESSDGSIWNGTDRSVTMLAPADHGFHVASFRGPRHIVFVVSQLNDDDLDEVAQAMVEPVVRALSNG